MTLDINILYFKMLIKRDGKKDRWKGILEMMDGFSTIIHILLLSNLLVKK